MKNSDTGTVKRGRGRPKGSKDKKKRGYTVSEKAIAQRNAATTFKDNNPSSILTKPPSNSEEADFNSRLVSHVMCVNEIASHADRHDLLSLKSCFAAYLKLCQEDGFKVNNLAAYSAMGMSYVDFYTFAKKDDPEIRAFCSFVKQTCAMFRETLVSESKLNPVIGIFWQRNFDGLRNDTEQVQSLQETEEYTGSNTYKEKYKNLIGE